MFQAGKKRARKSLKIIGLMGVVSIGASPVLTAGQASSAVTAGGAQLLTAQTLVSGTVVQGSSPVGGATVRPLVWPNESVIAALPVGAAVPTLTLPAVASSANGNFVVNLDPSTLPARYLDAKGRPDIELQIAAAGHMMAWRFTAARSSRGWTSVKNATDAAADGSTPANETLVANFGASPKITRIEGRAASAFSAGGMTPSQATAAAPSDNTTAVGLVSTPDGGACGTIALEWQYGREEPFTHVYPGKQAPATVTQNFGVDHNVGIAISVNGGKWSGGSAGGSRTISLSASGSLTLTSNSTAFNEINVRHYNTGCSAGGGENYIRAESVYAILGRIDPAAEPSFTTCTPYTSGDWTKAKGVNITYKSEVNVGVASVDAQSGYNSDTEITWHVKHKTDLCGSGQFGWASSSTPEAEANSYPYP